MGTRWGQPAQRPEDPSGLSGHTAQTKSGTSDVVRLWAQSFVPCWEKVPSPAKTYLHVAPAAHQNRAQSIAFLALRTPRHNRLCCILQCCSSTADESSRLRKKEETPNSEPAPCVYVVDGPARLDGEDGD